MEYHGKTYSMVNSNRYSVLPSAPKCKVYCKLKRMSIDEFSRLEEEKRNNTIRPKAYAKKKVW